MAKTTKRNEARKERKLRINSPSWLHVPGFFRWIREAVAPGDKAKAQELLESLGINKADAASLSDTKNEVITTTEAEDLLLTFEIS